MRQEGEHQYAYTIQQGVFSTEVICQSGTDSSKNLVLLVTVEMTFFFFLGWNVGLAWLLWPVTVVCVVNFRGIANLLDNGLDGFYVYGLLAVLFSFPKQF